MVSLVTTVMPTPTLQSLHSRNRRFQGERRRVHARERPLRRLAPAGTTLAPEGTCPYDHALGKGLMAKLSELARKARTLIIGGARSVEDPELFKKISLVALLAWVGLGVDGLTSSCYGPEEAFLALGDRIPLGVFVAAATALTILVISASYSQIVEAFPGGGGGYVVASKLLSPAWACCPAVPSWWITCSPSRCPLRPAPTRCSAPCRRGGCRTSCWSPPPASCS